VLLAGGTASRFGGAPKGLMKLGAARVADGPLQALAEVCDEVVIAANDPAADAWFPGHRVVRDRIAHLGALGALSTALDAGDGRAVVVCAWDMPFVPAHLLNAFAETVEAGASCCVPSHADGSLEPLCAGYAAACAPIARLLVESGERAAHRLVDAVGGELWETRLWLPPDDARRTFHNVNTMDDLRTAEAWLQPPQESAP
jgi:molybdenum cofactor guanylyltransferase